MLDKMPNKGKTGRAHQNYRYRSGTEEEVRLDRSIIKQAARNASIASITAQRQQETLASSYLKNAHNVASLSIEPGHRESTKNIPTHDMLNLRASTRTLDCDMHPETPA